MNRRSLLKSLAALPLLGVPKVHWQVAAYRAVVNWPCGDSRPVELSALPDPARDALGVCRIYCHYAKIPPGWQLDDPRPLRLLDNSQGTRVTCFLYKKVA